MVRPNSSIPLVKINRSKVNIYLTDLINEIIENIGTAPRIDLCAKRPDQLIENFFENYYVKLNTDGDVNLLDIKLKGEYSSQEIQILDYMINPLEQSKPLVLLGHEGVGKTTLLRFITSYLWFKQPILQEYFVPIYIELNGIREYKDRKVYFKQINECVYKNSLNFVLKYLGTNYKKVLIWISNNIPSTFVGKYDEKAIEQISETSIQEHISHLSQDEKIELFLNVLEYFSKFEKKVIFLIDNIDKFNIDLHEKTLDYIDEKLTQKFAFVVSMRTSTYNEIDGKIFQVMDKKYEIKYSVETIKSILLSRIDRSYKKIKTNSFPKITTNLKNYITSFINILTHKDSIDLLSSLSNQSLDSLFRKFWLITDSSYYNDSLLIRELLLENGQIRNDRGLPIWLMYSLLLGNHNGTFKSNNEVANCGIINLFSTKDSSNHLLRYFIRLHLLTSFYLNHEEVEYYFDIKEISEKYLRIFGNIEKSQDSFYRSIYRLLQSRLLYSFNSHNSPKYLDIKYLKEKINEDKLSIAPAGKYYLRNFIHRLDYLYFIKDDINWIFEYKFNVANISATRFDKIKNTFAALETLMKAEYEILEFIIEENNRKENWKLNIVEIYVENFSPYRILKDEYDPDNLEVLFTKWIYRSYANYIINILEIKDPYEKEMEKIEETIRENEWIEKIFLP